METCSSMKSSKQKLKRGDIISLLPDTVLHYILSFLDMKFVMNTSLLAKRWRELWRSVPKLNFTFSKFVNPISASRDDDIRFFNFIDHIFIHHDRSDIKKFSITYYADPEEDNLNIFSKFYSCVLASIRRGVQELILEIENNYITHLPLSLFHCKSLVTLSVNINSDLENEPIHLTATTFDLPTLKTLLLNRVIFPDENSTKAIFSKCPVLESLFLVGCLIMKGKTFHISVPSLKHLKIDYGFVVVDYEEFNIYAPNLTSLCFESDLDINLSIASFSSLTNAEIDLDVRRMILKPDKSMFLTDSKISLRGKHMIKLLETACSLEVLTLSAWMVEVISVPSYGFNNMSTRFLNLRIMHLKAWLYDGCIHAVIHLLVISPNIETLTLSLIQESPFCHVNELMSMANLVCNEEFAYIGKCIFRRLKYVNIDGVQGWGNELKLLEILLKCSTVLEKIVIISADSKERSIEFGEKVLSFPRASSNIGILII